MIAFYTYTLFALFSEHQHLDSSNLFVSDCSNIRAFILTFMESFVISFQSENNNETSTLHSKFIHKYHSESRPGQPEQQNK